MEQYKIYTFETKEYYLVNDIYTLIIISSMDVVTTKRILLKRRKSMKLTYISRI